MKKPIEKERQADQISHDVSSLSSVNDEKVDELSIEEEEEEERGFFHKMLKGKQTDEKDHYESRADKLIGSKRKNSRLGGKNLKLKTNKPIQLEDSEKMKTDSDVESSKLKFIKKEPNKQERRPKQICQYYINGACIKGNECSFSHDIPVTKKNETCKYFLSGSCMKGNECVFSHDLSAVPCKYFHACGYCVNGDLCKFSHQRLDEEDVYRFIDQNEDFMVQLYKTAGKTNMDEFLSKHLEKKKISIGEYTTNVSPVMLPQSMQQKPIQIDSRRVISPLTTNQMISNKPTTMSNLPNANLPRMPFIMPNMGAIPRPNIIGGIPPFNVQTFNMLLKNPMFVQFMRNPQLMQQMMTSQNFSINQSMNSNINSFMNPNVLQNTNTVSPVLESNEVIFNTNNVDKQVNLSSFVNKINPFEKPKKDNIQGADKLEKLEKGELIIRNTQNNLQSSITEDNLISNENVQVNIQENYEDDEEQGFFLKKYSGNKSSLVQSDFLKMTQTMGVPNQTFPTNPGINSSFHLNKDNKNQQTGNKSDFTIITQLPKQNQPKDPRLKNRNRK